MIDNNFSVGRQKEMLIIRPLFPLSKISVRVQTFMSSSNSRVKLSLLAVIIAGAKVILMVAAWSVVIFSTVVIRIHSTCIEVFLTAIIIRVRKTSNTGFDFHIGTFVVYQTKYLLLHIVTSFFRSLFASH